MIRRTFLILALIAVGAIILFTRDQQEKRGAGPGASQAPLQPGYFMTDAHIVQTGADGRPMYRMHADRIQQDPATLTVRLRHLELDYRATAPGDALGRTWKVTARQGDMPQAATRIDLSGNVEIIGQPLAGENGPVARIRTPKLSFDTRAEIVRTPEAVEVLWGASRVNAQGLTADLKAERIKLESKVNGRITR